jgi:hypothetical protein
VLALAQQAQIPIEQNPRALLLPACLRGCFSVPAYPLGAYIDIEILNKMHALDEGARGAKSTCKTFNTR